jgi:hypothetical protein
VPAYKSIPTRSHCSSLCCIQTGASDFVPARKSNAAPTHQYRDFQPANVRRHFDGPDF